jgi:hypothetical protein
MAAVVVPYQLRSRPTAAVVGVQGPTNPRVGLDLTSDLVARGPSQVEATLGYHVGIVGRTQEINDHFDRAWASGVARNGGRPMVTLLFTAAGQPADLASLPSVANGVHDGDLRRWARQIRAFRRPVYLSILRHVDRNWVATSAVANGGIPQDTARAWEHVRQLFSAQHANNVVWIWAPADPSLDSAYAPAAGTYDAVLLSLIEYPQTVWSDPATALAQVRRQHPHDRLLVEASLAGSEAKRLSWLRKLGAAVRTRGDISAVLYHEGGPAPAATVAERAAWSLADDPTLTLAFGSAVRAAGLDGLAVRVSPSQPPAATSVSNTACRAPLARWCT